MTDATALPAVLAHYDLSLRDPVRLAGGLINATWRLSDANGPACIVQQMHPAIPGEVNLNIACVTDYLAQRGCLTPRLIPNRHGEFWTAHAGATWRLLSFVEGVTHTTLPDLEHAFSAGAMLGAFHATMQAFSGRLPFPRPPVHEPARHRTFMRATLAQAGTHRLHPEVACLAREASELLDQLPGLPSLPTRWLHGDPKLSNLLFGPDGSPRCLVDLDTLTRSTLPYEVGDALRSWCNTRDEDAEQADFALDIFQRALEGYAAATAELLTLAETESLVTATLAIQLELAMRFAADALNEQYFGWDPTRFAGRGEHNLRRARNQLAGARQLAARQHEALACVRRIFKVAA